MRKLTESMETVLEYIATGIAPVDMARMESRSYALSFQGLERRGLVKSSSNGGILTEEGRAYWAEKNGAVVPALNVGDHVVRVGEETGPVGRVRDVENGRAWVSFSGLAPCWINAEWLALVPQEAPVITVESGDKVTKGGLRGRVLEVCTRAGVMLAAVAFGFDLVWVKVAELVTL